MEDDVGQSRGAERRLEGYCDLALSRESSQLGVLDEKLGNVSEFFPGTKFCAKQRARYRDRIHVLERELEGRRKKRESADQRYRSGTTN
jgi:50S ribosomal subunit-associated GTPase HflX